MNGCQKCGTMGASTNSGLFPLQGSQKVVKIGRGDFPLPALKPLGGGQYVFCPNCAITWAALLGAVLVAWSIKNGRG